MTSSVIRDGYRLANLKKFISSLATESLYVGIGRPQFWDVSTIPNNDSVDLSSAAYSAKNNVLGSIRDAEDMMALKLVNSTDVSHGISKLTWTAGKKYDIYRHDYDGTIQSVYDSSYPESLADAKYVVINASYDIYICLKQGRTGTTVNASLYSPETGTAIGTNTNCYKTADNYVWKFIGKTDGIDISTFSSLTHHPVRTLTSAPLITSTYYPQWTAQQNSLTYKGGIYTINVLNSGSGYNGGNAGTVSVTDAEADANFKIIGDGSGLQFSITFGSGGAIVSIDITNPGTGYTHANIVPATGVGAAFDIIFTPPYGLGANPVKDTSALFLLVSVVFLSDEGGKVTIENEYRKISLISNPYLYGTTTIANLAVARAYITLTVGDLVGGSVSFKPDDIITGGSSGAKGRVIDFNGTDTIKLIRTSSENFGQVGANNALIVGETLTTSGGPGTATITNITLPDIDTKTGDVIYSEYRMPILRQSGQSENIKIITGF